MKGAAHRTICGPFFVCARDLMRIAQNEVDTRIARACKHTKAANEGGWKCFDFGFYGAP